ncbi:hypothetical protein ABZU78_10735 [Rhodococcus erythropolis]|uniref:ORC-CDC6 family AAA ATPase n=1 Tax=Rhodococcus erythropolis TaxID=1833 RepID=UPI0033BA969B
MPKNPFEVTKAVDFTDAEIAANFVDFPGGGFESLAKPDNAMPTFLVGGKGGGRTHLMRFYSYALQKKRSSQVLESILSEGYIGIYFRCSGLNGSRFSGKRQSEDLWSDVFNYYMDIWLTEHALNVINDIQENDAPWNREEQSNFARQVRLLLIQQESFLDEETDEKPLKTIRDLVVAIRRNMDRSINNVAIRGSLDIDILTAPGQLVFETGRAITASLPGLENIKLTYLIDEFENLSEPQQTYINTLLREKELPVCFLVGSRLWGVRTHKTYSAGEKNIKGSEYEWIILETAYKKSKDAYQKFCTDLAIGRLRGAGHSNVTPDQLKLIFGDLSQDKFHDAYTLGILSEFEPNHRPYFDRLRKSIRDATGNEKLSDEVCVNLQIPEHPLLEKAAILRFYQMWSSDKRATVDAAVQASKFVSSLLTDVPDRAASEFLNHWKLDLLAQLCNSCNQKFPYLGFTQFVEMSGFLPRSFLTILKYITYWAQFNGEDPFSKSDPISSSAQSSGVTDAANWFYTDSLPLGKSGEDCDRSMRRLCTLFKQIRNSDKPTEVSCVTFSTDTFGVSQRALDKINECVSHNLLIEIKTGRTSRNKGSQHRKFQIHPMIAPIYALPTGRRGDLAMQAEEINSIFDPSAEESAYRMIANRRMASLNAPFAIRAETQEVLF